MDFLTKFGLEKNRLTALVMIALLLQGIMLYFDFPKRDNPAITVRTAVVTVQYSGMPPQRLESLIVTPVERKLRELGEVKDIRSIITTGSAVIYVDLRKQYESKKLPEIFQKLRNKMAELAGQLPEGTQGPFVNTNFGDVAIATIAITGDGFSYAELEETGKALQRELYTVKGLSKIELMGRQAERVWLEFDTSKLATLGLKPDQILSDLQTQNIILPAGTLQANGTSIQLEVSGNFKSVDDIKQVLGKIEGGQGFVRLEDLFTVRRGYVDPKEAPIFFNGQPAIVAAVQMQEGSNVQTVGDRLAAAVSSFEQRQAIGIELSYATFQANKVTDAINTALSNVGQTVAVVLIAMMLFLGFKSGFIIATVVPFAIAFSLLMMGPMGIELEQVSIAAVIISLGLLVDNGLVVVEDIQSQISRGKDPKQAALKAGRQFVIPLMVGSITTISAFIPMMVLEGNDGDFAFSLGAVVALMLIGSWFTAMYILPLLCVWFFRQKKDNDSSISGSSPIEHKEHWVLSMYGQTIRKLMPVAPVVLIVAYGLVAGSMTIFSSVRNEQFPLASTPQFLIFMDMQKGSSIGQTEKAALRVANWLNNRDINPEIINNILYVGSGGPRFDLGLNPPEEDPASAFFLINTRDFSGAVKAIDRARYYLALNNPEARFKVKRLSMGAAESGIVEVKVKGPDADRLLQLSREVEAIFAQAPGIEQNESNWGNKVLKVVADVKQDQARDFGISSQDISQYLASQFSGTAISVFRDGEKSIPIVVRSTERSRRSIENLANITLGVQGRLISLDELATIRTHLEFSQIRRENQQRTIVISGKSPKMTAGEMLQFISPELNALNLAGGYSVEIGGELKEAKETNEALANGAPLALMVMLAAIMFKFNSFRRVVIVFSTIPLVSIGVPFALRLADMPLSFFGILGFISLAGIIIYNAIVLIDQIDIERETLPMKEAVISAAKMRLRPIMLTSITTVTGLMPMAINGGEMWAPMAVVMIGGLSLSSILSLFFVPSGYYLLFCWDK